MGSHTSLWEYRVKPSLEEEFEQHYGPDGTWALLFRRATGYLGTRLLRDASEPLRYLTIDRWRSAEDYREFRERFAREYAELDAQCEALTTHEALIGEFTEIA